MEFSENGSYVDVSHSQHDDGAAAARAAEEAKSERDKLAHKETQAVTVLRVVVVVVLLCSAAVVTYLVYSYARQNEKDNFETSFDVNARKVVESFHNAVARKISAIDAMSVQITSHALATGSVFPNVTLPDFTVRGSNSRVLADGCLIDYLPIVTDEDRAGWEAYALENQVWLDKANVMGPALRLQQDIRYGYVDEKQLEAKNDANVTVPPEPPMPESIVGAEPETGDRRVEPQGNGPFLPVWQVTPILPGQRHNLGFNMLSRAIYAGGLQATMNSSKAVFDTAIDLRDPDSDSFMTNSDLFLFILSYSQYRHDIANFSSDPVTNMMYPIFDNFTPDRKLTGVLLTSLYWNLYFENILPVGSDGIVAVLRNTQGQVFTYEIDGPEVTFLGKGDHHDAHYNEYEIFEDVNKRIKQNAGPETAAFTEVDIDEAYNSYTIRVYPSRKMEKNFETDEPIYFAVIVICTFAFTSLVFAIYDFIVERRQRKLFNRALASGTILSSLFPEQIREKLLQETKEQMPARSKKSSPTWLANDSPVDSLENAIETERNGLNVVAKTAKPICNKYEHSTVLFADLAGFTAWSSKRTPEEVFVLLETLYGEFDKIAERRCVFKIETIGDCYVAVTGCPHPQDDHALIMVRFAKDCMTKMDLMTRELANTLGEDTADLKMRVGLHSGSVTAGVLRGQKSRFQLFGDTMNTASRMESNGVKGKIHISGATKDELENAGKGHWIIARENKIVAKGKGEMQTYFVDLAHYKKSVSGQSATSGSQVSGRSGDKEEINESPGQHPTIKQDEFEA